MASNGAVTRGPCHTPGVPLRRFLNGDLANLAVLRAADRLDVFLRELLARLLRRRDNDSVEESLCRVGEGGAKESVRMRTDKYMGVEGSSRWCKSGGS